VHEFGLVCSFVYSFVISGEEQLQKQILYGDDKQESKSKSEIQGFFPFDFAQGQNDDGAGGYNNIGDRYKKLQSNRLR
jgi:hypothetical protein